MADNQTGPAPGAASPNVEVTTQLYDEFSTDWKIMRDTFAGERVVKEAGECYLPRTSSMGTTAQHTPVEEELYVAYKLRAQFPDLVAPTVRGMTGIMTRVQPKFELTPAVEPLEERATKDNVTLIKAYNRTLSEVLTVGRYGLLADLDDEGNPQLVCYTAETIRNWVIESIGGKDVLTHLILDESRQEFNKQSMQWDLVERFRVLMLDEGVYKTIVYRKGTANFAPETDDQIENDDGVREPQLAGGKKLDFIPFVFINATDLTPDPDEIPLIGLGRISLAIYRKSADYEQALFMSGQETLFTFGWEDDKKPTKVGAMVIHNCTDPNGNAEYVGPSGVGLEHQAKAINDDKLTAITMGTKVLNTESKAAESGDALKLRFLSQTATLTSINNTVAAGFEKALRYAAALKGSGQMDENITCTANNEFIESRLAGQELTALVAAWQAQAISKQTLFENLQRGEVVKEGKTFEEEEEEIANDPIHLANRELEEAMLNAGNSNQQAPGEQDNPEGNEDETQPPAE